MDKQDSLTECYNKEIRPFIDVIDELRRIGVDQDVSLPNVVVVGDQSCGKSSIIEALSGIQLPRGTGIVTRCPLELQLKQTYDPSLKNCSQEKWQAFLQYDKQKRSTHFREEVGEMIRNAQIEICGSGKDVSDKLLTLRIEDPRPNAPELTLIDLPGISRTPIAGQSENVCQIIRNMVLKYISTKNTVILCMIAANLDFAVNESIQIAKSVDPTHERTIGVITKPDLADKHQCQEIMKVLNNTKYPLKKGYVIVKCRSQDELDENLSLDVSRANEMEYFDNNIYYQYADYNSKGIDNLSSKITEELVNVIKTSLPDLKNKINEGIQQAQQQLSLIPDGVPFEKHEKYIFLTKAIQNFNSTVSLFLLEGTRNGKIKNGYSDWRQYFEKFLESIEKKRKEAMRNKFEINNLQELIEMNRGSENSHFLNYKLFKLQINIYLTTYEDDADLLATNMYKDLESVLTEITDEHFKHFPDIRRDIKNTVLNQIRDCHKNCKNMTKWILKQEKFVFSMDALFTEELDKQLSIEHQKQDQVRKPNQIIPSEYISSKTSSNAVYLQRLLKVYLKITNKRLADRIPLTVSQCLLIELEEKLATKLMEYPYLIDIDKHVKENKKLAENRQKWMNKINRLTEAQHRLVSF